MAKKERRRAAQGAGKNMAEVNSFSRETERVTVYSHNNSQLCARGAAFHWWDAEYTSLHDHDYYEIFIITSGSTCHTLNGQRQTLGAGSLCLLEPRDCHRFTPLPAGGRCLHINLSLTAEKLGQLCAGVGVSPAQLLACRPRLFCLEDWDLSFFKQSARELNCLLEAGGRGSAAGAIVSEMALHAIVTVLRRAQEGAPQGPPWFAALLRKLHSPEYAACRVADVYRLAGYSAPVVIRTFRQYTGGTVIEALTRIKMDAARRLLATTDLTVLRVAEQLGYASLSHFNRLFRAAAGMTPREYRAGCRGAR